ncbi:MAG: dNTP triphosphohydrolase, partial [Eubacteriales bacterium]|nr:dNTP triphosphohydrolase [Eubacteriales bacterium]
RSYRKPGSGDLRSEYEKDYHRIIGSASFRRLQDKTQVFPLDKSDFVRTRLTHSLEVSSLSKSLAQNIGRSIVKTLRDPDFTVENQADICDILQCAGLLHDIGNPPFGHFGETVIRGFFAQNFSRIRVRLAGMEWEAALSEILSDRMQADFLQFEGNAQALRVVTKLHYLVDEHGMNLTKALLATMIKYPVDSLHINKKGAIREHKMGYFLADQAVFDEIETATGLQGRRHPLTYLLEAGDDIAYHTADIEDAFKKGFLSYEQLVEELERDAGPEDAPETDAARRTEDTPGMDAARRTENAPETDAADGIGTIPESAVSAQRMDAAAQQAHTARASVYRQLIDALRRKYRRAQERGLERPDDYAIQNWIIQVQGRLIAAATEGFTFHYNEIMAGIYGRDLFAGTGGEHINDRLGDIARRYVFESRPIITIEISAERILTYLLDRFVHAVLYYDTDRKLSPVDERLVRLISENYRQIYHIYAKEQDEVTRLYLRLLLVTDYVCGMTDSYAQDLYRKLNGEIP